MPLFLASSLTSSAIASGYGSMVAVAPLAANPDLYVGAPVTVTAAVELRYGATAFSIDRDRTKSAAQDILVLAPVLNAPVELNT